MSVSKKGKRKSVFVECPMLGGCHTIGRGNRERGGMGIPCAEILSRTECVFLPLQMGKVRGKKSIRRISCENNTLHLLSQSKTYREQPENRAESGLKTCAERGGVDPGGSSSPRAVCL